MVYMKHREMKGENVESCTAGQLIKERRTDQEM